MKRSFSSLRETEEDEKSQAYSADFKATDLLVYFCQLRGGTGGLSQTKVLPLMYIHTWLPAKHMFFRFQNVGLAFEIKP